MDHALKTEQSPSPRNRAIWVALLLAGAFLLYMPSVGFNYIVFDDPIYITENPHVTGGLTLPAVKWAFTTYDTAEWQPMTWLTYMATQDLTGSKPWGHHLVNVIFHVLNTGLLLWFFSLATGRFWPSLLVAALFAVHPLRVESVAWVAERKDVLSGFFFAATLVFYAAYAKKPGFLKYAGVFLCLALGLMSKPMLVTVPCLLILLDYWPLGRIRIQGGGEGRPRLKLASRWVVLDKIPLFALSAASAGMTLLASTQRDWMPANEFPLFWRVLNSVTGYAIYIRQMVWPENLTLFYANPGADLPLWAFAVSLALVAGVTVAALVWVRRRPYVFVGWFWFLGTLVPVIGLTQQATADRFTYVPMLGLYAALVWGAAEFFRARKVPVRWAAGIAAAVLVALSTVTWFQLSTWRDSVSLFDRCVTISPDSFPCHLGLIIAYQDLGQGNKAFEHYVAAANIKPTWLAAWHNKNGENAMNAGRYGEAEQQFTMALQLDPEDKFTMNRHGASLIMLRRFDEAGAQFQKALALDPDFDLARKNLENLPIIRQGLESGQKGFRFTIHL